MKIKMTVDGYRCLRCDYEWIPKKGKPKVCPNCHSPYWDRPRKNKKRKVDTNDPC